MLDQIRDFFLAGGPVLWVIFLALSLLWFFIFEKFWWFYKSYPLEKRQLEQFWMSRPDKSSWTALAMRRSELSRIKFKLYAFSNWIKTLIAALPLLGLLGTVTGMIAIFDVINIFGTGNPRLMAGGISMAVIPTAAGLVSSLSGLYFAFYFQKRAERELRLLTEALSI